MASTIEAPKRRKEITYRYIATTRQGQLVKGSIKAASEIAAERLLISKGYIPEHVEVAPSMFSLEEAFPTLFRVKPRDVIVFSRQLATLLRSGISLLPAMEILYGQVGQSRAFNRILGSIINDLRSGGSFSQAVSKHPRAFNEIYCRTIAVGEETGNLEIVLNRMADYMEQQISMTQKVKKALTYPMMVTGVGVVVVIMLITVVMPKLLGMFQALSVELPLPTRILIALTDVFANYTLYIIIAGASLGALLLWLVKQPAGGRLLDRMRLNAPFIGPPTLLTELGRFTRTMSVLISAGLKLQDTMELLPHATTNKVFRDALHQVNEKLLLGEGLSEPMAQIGLFPPLLVQMVAVGEESNTLDFTMGVVADFYETAAEEKTTALVGMLGPLTTIGIALLVGFIALAVIMPMYTLTGAFG
ncbi:MAG TPA: type II secretion system F family protein [Dehalococcoidia bacterium]|jgi:type IV pilus assembly protein PilC|nr:type II secretion system F family protein [Dehalococcoidia bacterium]